MTGVAGAKAEEEEAARLWPGQRRLWKRSDLEQAVPDGDLDQVPHRPGLKLGEEIVLVGFNSFWADVQIAGNGLDAPAVCQKAEYFFFAG